MTGEQLVRDAIGFNDPARIPVWYVNQDMMDGDILLYDLAIEERGRNEWGFHFESLDDGTMGQVRQPVLPTWEALEGFAWPMLRPERRLAGLDEFKRTAGGRYLLGGLGITGFTLYTFMRGFESAMVDLVAERDKANKLLDRIFDFEIRLVELAAKAGLHGVHFADDWGTQDNLFIRPELWHEVFAERYRAQFERAHELDLHVWFHCCGNITQIVPSFHDIGVDVMNISQPNAVDLAAVGRACRGRQCFLMPISYQTVSITGTAEEIHAEAQRLYRQLGTSKGGFIGYVEEYSCMGMSEANYRTCADAFRALSSDA